MITALIAGIVFGFFMQHARVNRNDVIAGIRMFVLWSEC